MISRVAEACFWLYRYVERMENIARLLQVNRSFVLDVSLPEADRWAPVIVVTGEQERFPKMFSQTMMNDGELVQDYLTWNENNPSSIASSLRWARENARSIREVISLEMWESVNDMWHWLTGRDGRRQYNIDRDAFYARIKEFGALIQGVCHSTMLHEEPFDFMRLGMLLERAGQTARIIDVKYHGVGPRDAVAEGPIETAQWLALLRSCSATEPFFKRVRQPLRGRTVVAFLVLEERFPRSVLHCLDRAWNFLRRIQRNAGRDDITADESGSGARLSALLESLRAHDAESLIASDIHAELTRVIDATAELGSAIHADFFEPTFAPPSHPAGAES